MYRHLLILMILSSITLWSFGQDNLPDNVHFRRLTNGLEILVVEDHTVPLATVEIVVHNGAYTESPEYDGLSHLYEHMFFKANKDYPSQEEYMARVSELGVEFNGTTSNERVNYFITLSSSFVNEAIDFMNSAIRYPLFLEEEMKKENPVVDAEFQRNESNPFFHLMDKMDHYLWGDLYSRKNTIGDHDIILSATPEKMKTIQEKYYVPNNTMIAVAGDVNPKEVINKITGLFGDWEPTLIPPDEKYKIPNFPPLQYSEQFVMEDPNAQVPIFMLSWHGPDTRSDLPSTYAADVFSYITQQQSSKLNKALVETGLAFQVSVSYSTLRYVGPISVFMVPNPNKVEEAYKVLWEQIQMWDDPDYYTDEQLQTAKDLLAIDDAYAKEKTSEYIHTITYWWASASLDYYFTYVDKLQQVTREDITKYITKYIQGQPFISGLMLPQGMREAANVDEYFTDTKKFYTFSYKENTSEFSDSSQMNRLNSLMQFAKINPERYIRINGFADKSELFKLKNKEMKAFIDSMENFKLIPKDKIEPKSFTLSLYRSLNIAKYLVEQGVEPSRITGTGVLKNGANDEEEIQNRRVEIELTLH